MASKCRHVYIPIQNRVPLRMAVMQERSQLLQVLGGAHLYVALGESTLGWSELSFRSSVFQGLFFFLFQTLLFLDYSDLSIFQPGYWSATSSIRSSLDVFLCYCANHKLVGCDLLSVNKQIFESVPNPGEKPWHLCLHKRCVRQDSAGVKEGKALTLDDISSSCASFKQPVILSFSLNM